MPDKGIILAGSHKFSISQLLMITDVIPIICETTQNQVSSDLGLELVFLSNLTGN
ncbi:hypothetical protein [Nostoc sp. UHCC 0251]|uniref:hypothetical protein n=1 Tax=Nostoc sp. UHCC 0251 TaxID=3110240 RepID=UPI002B213CFB|nr:hypothetical protein [Nostoc sp. UHCC 0251]MEA5627367.1 hypothetical protein [Nostoc sp. UHCC 0251]